MNPSDRPRTRRDALRLIGTAAALAAPAVRHAAGAAPVAAVPPAAVRAAAAHAAAAPTPAQTEGPFYPRERPAERDPDLLRVGTGAPARGTPAWVEGTVTDLDGRPLRGATVEIWQCDADGHYLQARAGSAEADFQGFGEAVLGADGRYRFRTLRPVPYPGRAPHIHFKLRLGGREVLTTQLYVEGDSRNPRDFLWRRLDAAQRAALTRPFVAASDGLRAEFPIVVAA